MQVDVLNIKGEKVETIELSDEIFGVKPNPNTIYEANKAYLANQRLGTASTKRRGEVSGSGRKLWRQKGTGRARIGSIRSPLWKGGGIVFGPKPRSFKIRLHQKVRRNALISSLSAKALEKKILVIDGIDIKKPKTKIMARIISKLNFKKPLFVLVERSPDFIKSIRNIPNVHSCLPENLCSYYILSHNELVLTKEGIKRLEDRLLGIAGEVTP
ncbi:MAG: 50S ribosomal protein L4 [bacterium]